MKFSGSVFALAMATALALPTVGHAEGRYEMQETENGIIRLDTQTGRVSLCKFEQDELICRTAADDRTAYETEIEQLNKELEALKQNAGTANDAEMDLPSDEEIDEVVGTFERFTKAIMDAMKRLEENLETAPEDSSQEGTTQN